MHGYEIEESSIVTSFIDFQLSGNIIPSAWFKTVHRNGKAYLLAINLLADVLYWYRPIETRDEKTGKFIGWRKKFKGDMLQRSYNDWADQFGVSKKQVIDAVRFLCTKKLLIRDVRVLRLPTRTLGGVTFFAPSKTQIEKASQVAESGEVKTPPLQICMGTPTKKEGYPSQNVGPCTEITTETTTRDIKERATRVSSSANIDDSFARASEIFEFWKAATGHTKAKIAGKRERAVRARLKQGFTVNQIKIGIVGCLCSDFHRGQSSTGKVYDDIELICRDVKNLEQFIAMGVEAINPGWRSGCCEAPIQFEDGICSGCGELRNLDTVFLKSIQNARQYDAA